jgi:hypothetical protein
MQIPHIIDKIYIKDKFTGEMKVFDTLEEAHEHQKKWCDALLTREYFLYIWNDIGDDICLNIWDDYAITNQDMREIAEEAFFFVIEKYRKKVGIK